MNPVRNLLFTFAFVGYLDSARVVDDPLEQAIAILEATENRLLDVAHFSAAPHGIILHARKYLESQRAMTSLEGKDERAA